MKLGFVPGYAVHAQSTTKYGEKTFDVYVRNLDVERSELEELINKELAAMAEPRS